MTDASCGFTSDSSRTLPRVFDAAIPMPGARYQPASAAFTTETTDTSTRSRSRSSVAPARVSLISSTSGFAPNENHSGRALSSSSAPSRSFMTRPPAWFHTIQSRPMFQPAHRWFEEQVARTPDAPAVVFDGHMFTYHELEIRANRLAHRLLRVTGARETCVGVVLRRGVDHLVALLALHKAGLTLVPVS